MAGVEREYVRLRLVPVSFTEARVYVAQTHRHNDPPIAARASVGIADDAGTLRGVGILGIPKARNSADGRTAEIVRVATDGVPNGCSMIYGALVRVAWALGYDRVLTYTLAEESGSSLRAAGWTNEGAAGGGEWSRNPMSNRSLQANEKPTMFFESKVPSGPKVRWSIRRRGV